MYSTKGRPRQVTDAGDPAAGGSPATGTATSAADSNATSRRMEGIRPCSSDAREAYADVARAVNGRDSCATGDVCSTCPPQTLGGVPIEPMRWIVHASLLALTLPRPALGADASLAVDPTALLIPADAPELSANAALPERLRSSAHSYYRRIGPRFTALLCERFADRVAEADFANPCCCFRHRRPGPP